MKVKLIEIIYIPFWAGYESISLETSFETGRKLRIKAILKFLENAKIVGLGRKYRSGIEVEIENGDRLEKIKDVLETNSIHYEETKLALRDYSEGKITLDEAHVQMLRYIINKNIRKNLMILGGPLHRERARKPYPR